jgi:molybdenum cofactor cytidylyltransferase
MGLPIENITVRNVCAIILAAGESSRLRQPKQLLAYKGESFLQRTINAAQGAHVSSVVLVLGSNAESILEQTETRGAHIIKNENWQTGMASSIVTGVNAIKNIQPVADAVILLVCDQPYVDVSLLTELISKQHSTGKPIVACQYGNTLGVPALFHESFFNALADLQGDKGARKIIRQSADHVAVVSFPQGATDIDTLEMYENL